MTVLYYQITSSTAQHYGIIPSGNGPVGGYILQPQQQTTVKWLPHVTCLACGRVRLQIVASDGVWDVMDPREAANHVMDVISAGGSAEEAARQLVQDTIMLAECSPGGDTDNTTALVAVFE